PQVAIKTVASSGPRWENRLYLFGGPLMQRNTVLLSLVAVCCCFTLALAGDAPSGLAAASGIVDKVDKDALTVQPRGAGGKFGKKVVLKITGTSKVTIVSQEKRGG